MAVAYTKWSTGENTEVIVQNIVYTCSLTCKSDHASPYRLELHDVFVKFQLQGAQLNKRKFAAVILRVSVEPIIAILLFEHGRVVCTGAKKKQQAKFEIKRIVEKLEKCGHPDVFVEKLTVQNLVANAYVPSRVNQRSLSLSHSDFCTFDNEAFPGVIIRHPEVRGKLTVLLFASGKMVVTGAKKLDDVTHALEKVKPMIEAHTIRTPAKQFNDVASNMFSKSALIQNQDVRNEIEKTKEIEEMEEDALFAQLIEMQLEQELARERRQAQRIEKSKREEKSNDLPSKKQKTEDAYTPNILKGLKAFA